MHENRNIKRPSLWIFALLIFLGLANIDISLGEPVQAGSQDRTTSQPATWEKCQQCHEEIVKGFGQSVHGKSARFLTGARAANCDTCHGDTSKHVESAEAKDILNPAKMTPATANETCLSCHARDQRRMLWQGSQHENNKVSCVSCHSNHHPKSAEGMLARRTEQELCLSCHSERRKDFYQRSTHLFRTEHQTMKVDCVSCHNPHGGEADRMLVARSVNDLCFSCHAEKRGPFLWEHAPVRENCLNCHSPHGTNNPKLLTNRVHLICQQCHIHLLPRHSTAAGKPLDIWSINRGCVNCHSQVHGSNHPSGRTFTR